MSNWKKIPVFVEEDREVSTEELFGGESFDEVFPTVTREEVEEIREALREEQEDE